MESVLQRTTVSLSMVTESTFILLQLCVFSIAIYVLLYLGKVYIWRKTINEQFGVWKTRWYDILQSLSSLPIGSMSANEHSAYILQVMCGHAALCKNRKLFCFWMSYSPFIILVKAKAVEELLSSSTVLEKGWSYNLMEPWLGTGLLTSKGSKWKSRRKLLTPSFHFDILKDFLPIFNEQSDILVEILKEETNKEWINIVRPITLCSLDIICETTLGVHVGAQKNSELEYVQAVIRSTTTIMDRITNPRIWLDWMFYRSSAGIQFKKDLKCLHTFTRNVIQKKKALLQSHLKEHGTMPQNVKKRQALMDLLLDHHMNHQDLTEEDIREEVDTFVFEGHDTTSMGMSWALYLIGLYPEIQSKIQEELDMIFGDDDRPITTDDLKQMSYLECALKESQRLYPSVPMFARQIQKEITIDGAKVPKGCVCTVLAYMLHRDPDVFSNPEVFDPERFFPENSIGRHPYAYVPFSAGPRNCIGQRFAMMEEKTVIANVLRKFNLQSLDNRDKIEVSAEMILRTNHPIKIKVTERQSS